MEGAVMNAAAGTMEAVAATATAKPILETDDVKVAFDGFYALGGVSLAVMPGELRVIIGANGAGKSTLLDVICGKTRPKSGRVIFEGQDITGMTEHMRVRAGIGRKFQTPSVFREMTVRDHLKLASAREFRVFENLFRRKSIALNDVETQTAERIGLAGKLDTPASALSHGQLQWLELGMVLVQSPKLVLLDEPTAGMTHAETEKTAEILQGLAGAHTVLVIEHDMSFVRQICRKITVLHMGRVLVEGSAQEVERNPKVIEAYLGKAGISDAAAS